MPLMFILILVALPLADIYASLRLAEWLNVPGWLVFIPGVLAGLSLMRRESRLLQSRFAAALADLSLPGLVFDSGRRMAAGLLLLLPGLISDVFGVFLLLMPNRTHAMAARTSPGTRTVVEGEYRRVD